MTKQEAIQAMGQGKKVTHEYFMSHEWITLKKGSIYTEDGYSISPALFFKDRAGKQWEEGWSIIEEH
jgi:hypothetical protein